MTAPILFALIAFLVGVLALWSYKGHVRAIAYTTLVIATGALWWAATGHSRPAIFSTPEGAVAAFALDEPTAIYIWLLPPGAREPVAIKLPWSKKDASDLIETERRAKERGQMVQMGGGEDKQNNTGDEKPPTFYLPGPPQLPVKHEDK